MKDRLLCERKTVCVDGNDVMELAARKLEISNVMRSATGESRI